MHNEPRRGRQLVDWSSVLWAGLGAGTLFLLLNLFVTPRFAGGNAWTMLRMLASLVLGEGIVVPPATFSAAALGVGLAVHATLSLAFAALLAIVLHRWGLVVGIAGGALLGVALYAINLFSLTLWAPWFFALHSPAFLVSHALFGASAGGLYEALEVELFANDAEPATELTAVATPSHSSGSERKP